MKQKLKETVAWLKGKGVDYADCRYVRQETEALNVSDGNVDSLSRNLDVGVGIRVLYNGAWGFAGTALLTSGELKKAANLALKIARASAITRHEPAVLAEQETFVDHYRTPYRIDPFAVPTDDKIDLLMRSCDILKKSNKIKTAQGEMRCYRTNKLFLSTEGAEIEQDLLESGGGYECVANDGKEAHRRSFPNSFGGDYACRGYEVVEEMDLVGNAERVREEAIALLITDDNDAVDLDYMATALNTTYWAEHRPYDVVEESVRNSVVLTLLDGDRAIGFSRIVGDGATFAWICDIYVDPTYRGRGLGVWLVECTASHPFNQVSLSMLATKDAFTLYKKFGYELYPRAMARFKK